MFGTLVSTDFDRGRLEFVENPDPIAAVSRNIRDKIHISCSFCRSRKIRCSGGRKRCTRCETMGLECVYPQNRGGNRRLETGRSRRASTPNNTNVSARTMCDEGEPGAEKNQQESAEELALKDLNDTSFDYACIEESFFTPWIADTPMHHNSDGESSSSSISTAASAVHLAVSESSCSSVSTQSRNAETVLRGRPPELSTVDTSFTSLYNPSTTNSISNLEFWEQPRTTHDDISWAMDIDIDGMAELSPGPHQTLEPRSKTRRNSVDTCRCLRSSISFLGELVSKTASHESRIDLLLADARSSIETFAVLVACERCAALEEQNMLLAIAARQISVICGKTANYYRTIHRKGLHDISSSRQETEHEDASTGPVDISVSTYHVNRRERLHLLRGLVILQIVEFQQLLGTIKSRYHDWPSQGKAEALVEAENHIRLALVAMSSHS